MKSAGLTMKTIYRNTKIRNNNNNTTITHVYKQTIDKKCNMKIISNIYAI